MVSAVPHPRGHPGGHAQRHHEGGRNRSLTVPGVQAEGGGTGTSGGLTAIMPANIAWTIST
jgi:hypothetical protein